MQGLWQLPLEKTILTAANTHREGTRDRMGHKSPVPLISETIELSEEASK